MTALQNLEVGLNMEPLLLYNSDNLATCLENDIGDSATTWQNGGWKAIYQCRKTPQGNYCARRATNGPLHVPGVLAAYRPNMLGLFTSCSDCVRECPNMGQGGNFGVQG